MLSVIIPSRTERFLDPTIQSVLDNAVGDVRVFPVLDGYEPPELNTDPRVTYIRLPQVAHTQKRHGINQVVELTDTKYIMALDAHCLLAKGFDQVLIENHKPNWVQIPRRHRLDPENWCLQPQCDDRPPIDYEYTMWPLKFNPRPGLHGYKWDARTWDRWNIPVDDTMHFQGSCWFMTKEWFKERGFMKIEGYTGWGQEAEEIGLETWKAGGRVITNKLTYYAHLHKGPKYGRMYHLSSRSIKDCNAYSFDYWVHKNKDFFISFIEKFWPVPGWPNNWKDQLWVTK